MFGLLGASVDSVEVVRARASTYGTHNRTAALLDRETGGADGRFRPEMPVIWVPGQWVTAALRPGDRPAALSNGGSYWAHRFSGRKSKIKAIGRARYR